jgi:hypothetical protein
LASFGADWQVFEITPEGLKPTVEVDSRQSIRPLTGRRLDRAIMVVMALAIAYFVTDKFRLSKRRPPATYRGETDAAFEWLERAYGLRDNGMTIIAVDPLLHGLHGDPRFDALLHKLKLDDWKRQVSASWTQSGAEK